MAGAVETPRARPQAARGFRWWTLPAGGAAALVLGLALALWAEAGEAVFLDRLVTAFANCF